MLTLIVVVFYRNTLIGTKPRIITAERHEDHPCHFYIEAPPPGFTLRQHVSTPVLKSTLSLRGHVQH